jgi:WD40 repeat protein
MWDIHRGRCVRVFTGAHPTNTSSILSLAVSPDGLSIASGGDDGSVVVWDIAQGKPIKRFGALPVELRAAASATSTGKPFDFVKNIN